MEEVKRKEMELYQLKKKTAEYESKLKQQHVCNDQNSALCVHVCVCPRHCMRQCVRRGTCAARASLRPGTR